MRFLTVEEVIEIHTRVILLYGGLDGIRDMGLLHSSVEMPKAMFHGQYLHPSLFDQAAAYLFHIVSNHPFLDGNKRTGLATAITFLYMHEIQLQLDEIECEEYVVGVAKGQINKEELSAFFEKSAK